MEPLGDPNVARERGGGMGCPGSGGSWERAGREGACREDAGAGAQEREASEMAMWTGAQAGAPGVRAEVAPGSRQSQ